MKLQDALQETEMAETYYDGYTAVVREEDLYVLTIQHGGMPPHFSKRFETLEDVEAEMTTTHATQPIRWSPVETD